MLPPSFWEEPAQNFRQNGRSTVVAVPRGYNAMIALQGPRSDRRQRRRIAAIFGAGVAAVLASFPFDVVAASCGSYPKDIRAAVKKHVETLRALERETTDRLKGLDTRTFDYLAAQARAASRFRPCGACARRRRKRWSV